MKLAKNQMTQKVEKILIPKNFIEISDEDFLTIQKLIDSLDDLEDVQNVYSNYKIKDS